MKKTPQAIWDVIVVGGGAAGMMAAGRAAERGARVLLLEKNATLGKKLLITGGGRCNVTNGEPNTRTLLSHYKDSDKFLFSAFAQYSVADTLDFFNGRKMSTKVEDAQRVFPTTDKAKSVWDVLVHYLKAGGVEVRPGSVVKKINTTGAQITGVTLTNGETLEAPAYIIATGGKSRPETGSTGDGFRFLRELGHSVNEPDASLVPIALCDTWTKTLSGLTLPEVKISVYQGSKRFTLKTGRLLFTHVGLSGPTILNMSKGIGELLEHGEVRLLLDIFPKLDDGALDRLLVDTFTTESNKQFKNALTSLLPTAFAHALVPQTIIMPDCPCHSISKEDRKGLVTLLKHLPLTVKSLLGVDKAIVTSGGVALTEINFKTMQSRRYNNLYIIGDLLNIDRPSGGYSLQLCWTTGYVAGSAITLPS